MINFSSFSRKGRQKTGYGEQEKIQGGTHGHDHEETRGQKQERGQGHISEDVNASIKEWIKAYGLDFNGSHFLSEIVPTIPCRQKLGKYYFGFYFVFSTSITVLNNSIRLEL